MGERETVFTDRMLVQCINAIKERKGDDEAMRNLSALFTPLVRKAASDSNDRNHSSYEERLADYQETIWLATLKFDCSRLVHGSIKPLYIAYITRAIKNRYRSLLKKSYKMPYSVLFDELDDIYESGKNPITQAIDMMMEEQILQEIAKLPEIDQKLILGNLRDGISNEDLAKRYHDQQVGCGEAVRKRNIRNIRKIKETFLHK